MSQAIAQSRCAAHPDREAAARCPGCSRFFCRECVTEHAGRVLCARCLAAQATAAHKGPKWSAVKLPAAAASSFVMLWVVLYYLGTALAAWPG